MKDLGFYSIRSIEGVSERVREKTIKNHFYEATIERFNFKGF